jgi:hypothetical protein
MRRAAHAVESKAVVHIEVAVSPGLNNDLKATC